MIQKKGILGLVIIVLVFCTLSLFSGCTSNQNSNTNGNSFLGTWVGQVEMPMFGGNNTTTVSRMTFIADAVEMTLNNDRGVSSMDFTYTITGDTLVVKPSFTTRGGFPGEQPGNGSMPPGGMHPGNGTRPPMNNGSWPPNGTRPPGNGQPFLSVSFTYRFNDDYAIVYLNGSPLTKVQ